MAFNNTIILTGNIGAEAKIHEKNGNSFASVSLATFDSYKDEEGDWINKETIWHDLLVFSPKTITTIKALKTGTRIKVTGVISYQPFKVQLEDGSLVTKKQATIIVSKLELAPLFKKTV